MTNASSPDGPTTAAGAGFLGGPGSPLVPDRAVLAADGLRDEPETWPVESRAVRAEGAVQSFVDDEVRTPAGGTMRRQYTTHPGAVAIVAWNEHDQLAVIKQYRHPVGYRLVEIPAGLLDHPGEDPLLAARRELAEEVGLDASEWRVLVDLFSSPGAHQESLRVYLATGLSPAARPEVLDAEEADMGVHWAGRQALLDAVYVGRVQSASLIAGLLALETARLAGRLEGVAVPTGESVPADLAAPITADVPNDAMASVPEADEPQPAQSSDMLVRLSLRPADAPWPARQVWASRLG